MERSGAFSSGHASPGARAPHPPRAGVSAFSSLGFTPSAWAHELASPEVGCLLVARQPGMDFFDGTVVLVAAHGGLPGI
jgi:hypothetical protein